MTLFQKAYSTVNTELFFNFKKVIFLKKITFSTIGFYLICHPLIYLLVFVILDVFKEQLSGLFKFLIFMGATALAAEYYRRKSEDNPSILEKIIIIFSMTLIAFLVDLFLGSQLGAPLPNEAFLIFPPLLMWFVFTKITIQEVT